MSGWADSGYEDRKGQNPTFTSSFHPVFLWKLDDRLSFESDLAYTVISDHLDDLCTFSGGNFLTPFGAFIRRQHQSWSNKMADDPLALDLNNGLVPSYTQGASFEGGFEAPCSTRFNYAAYVGMDRAFRSIHRRRARWISTTLWTRTKVKRWAGDWGFLPTADLEFGASFQTSRVGEETRLLSKVDATLFGSDISYVNDFDAIKGSIDLKFEWIWTRVDRGNYHFSPDT